MISKVQLMSYAGAERGQVHGELWLDERGTVEMDDEASRFLEGIVFNRWPGDPLIKPEAGENYLKAVLFQFPGNGYFGAVVPGLSTRELRLELGLDKRWG
jgi:hypothetical protein